MATVNKDFKIKSGLIVEGTTATVNGFDILTKKQGDQDYIVNLIGGTATSANTPDTVVKRDELGNFAAENVTVNTLYVGGSTENGIDVVNGDTEIGSNNGILLSASDDISLNSGNGDIVLNPDGTAYYGSKSSANIIATRSYADGVANDATSSANTYTDAKISGEVADRNDAIGYAISSEVTRSNDAISTAKVEAIASSNNYTDGEITTALSTASSDATTKANGAKTYADGLISTEISNRNSAIATAKGEAISEAEGYTDSAISTEVSNRNSAISSAITALDLSNTYDAKGAAAQALADANTYTDGEIAALVDSAPELLNTLNELAAAIANNPNYATDVASAVSGRVAKSGDTMTGFLTLSGAPTLDLHAATKGYVDTTAATAQGNAEDYADGEITTALSTAQGYATTAQTNAESYADGVGTAAVTTANSYTDGEITTALSTAQGYADSVASDLSDHEALSSGVHGVTGSVVGTTDSQDLSNKRFIDTTYFTDGVTISNEGQIAVLSPSHEFEVKANVGPLGLKSYNDDIVLTPGYGKDVKWGADVLATQTYVDNQTTSDIEEGTNQYFTDARAKTSAADLLTGANLTNITITGTGAGLTITAENGVADSTTDDLDEGTTNKYFTPQRAVDALEAVVPNFTAVELNSVAKQVAATLSAPTAGIQVAHSFAKADYRSAEYLVKVAYGTHTEISKVLLTLDTSDNIAITEYGIVGTNGSASSISAGISGSNVELQVTTSNNNSTVTVVGTLLA
jgi:hypothetical protein